MSAATLTAAREVVGWLAAGELFTDIAEWLSGEKVICDVLRRAGPGVPDPGERQDLEAWCGEACAHRRMGTLRTASGRLVAYVSSVYLAGRLPPGAHEELTETDAPLGRVLEPYGRTRECLAVRAVSDSGIAVRTRGRLLLPGEGSGKMPVALAWEEMTEEFLRS